MLNNSTPQIVSEEEKKVLELEGRHKIAEAGLSAASEGKKKIEKDIEKINEDIESGKLVITKAKKELNTLNDEIVKTQNVVRVEKQVFEELKKQNNAKLISEQKDIDALTEKKIRLELEISSLSKKHENDKLAKAGEITTLESKKAGLVEEIRKTDVEKAGIIEKTNLANETLADLELQIKKKTEEKLTADNSVVSLVNEAENQKGIIQNNTSKVNQLLEEIQEKEGEVADMDSKIEKKKEEYAALEAKAFALLTKEETLASKESFIRSKYEKAGIAYE